MMPTRVWRIVVAWLGLLALGGGMALSLAARAAEPDTSAAATDDAAVKAAVASATQESDKWLAQLDAGKFAESWSEAAGVFKAAVTQADWAEQLTQMHQALGKTTIRKLRSADYSKTLRGAPSGQYVTVNYLTQVEKAPPAIETIAVAKDPDGQWRIAGYNITRAPEMPK